MTNDELSSEYRSSEAAEQTASRLGSYFKRLFAIPSSFAPALRDHSSFTPRKRAAFTLVELLTVIAIIICLAGLVLATASYVQNKGKRSRATAEIAAISAALEDYKADYSVYPADSVTSNFDVTTPNISDYAAPSLKLYESLSGDLDHNRTAETKTYFPFKPNQLSPADEASSVTSLRDPFGNPYGYSTMKTHNPTFDLWSVADGTAGASETKWIKNW